MRLLLLLATSFLLLTSCALEYDVPPATAGPLDATFRASTGLSTGKVKFKGPVTFQLGGAGNRATTISKATAPVATGGPAQDLTKAGQNGGAVATSPGATAGATTRTGVPTWQLVVGGVFLLVLLLLGLWLKFRPSILKISD
jgi:hypothetical protein